MRIQENKELLLKDLCARVPYDTIVSADGNSGVYLRSVDTFGDCIEVADYCSSVLTIKDVKPYLRPLSSMTSKEWCEYCDACVEDDKSWVIAGGEYKLTATANREDFFNSHYFDYSGLIEKGLALEATEDMYK